MRIAVSQPEHFPYLGFFQKMCACDLFVILDDVQFSGPRSFQNRNRYLNKYSEYIWFTVPVKKGAYFQLINEVEVSADRKWRSKLKRRLYQDLKFERFDEIYDYENLLDINLASINYCRHIFDISTPMIKASSLNIKGQKAERIYNLCKMLNADTYVAGLGSKEYMSSADFKDIEVQFFYPQIENYESSLVYALRHAEEVSLSLRQICSSPLSYCKGDKIL